METRIHSLLSPASGTQRSLHSLHYGHKGVGHKVYLQASLHADELPGMLVLHHLRTWLDAAEKRGDILGEVVLVPLANPIGLDQTLMHYQAGRFEHASMENFNRNYPDYYGALKGEIAGQLTSDEEHNKRVIRSAMHAHLMKDTPQTELQSLRQTLMLLAYDADAVLDLHCDFEAVMHAYIEEPYLTQIEPLTRYLGCQAVLHNRSERGECFDESLSTVWWKLREDFAGKFPIPLAGMATTIELRGQADVYHYLAESDAQNIYHYLQYIGVVAGTAPPVPPSLCHPTPLSGTDSICAPHAGVIAFVVDVGQTVRIGDPLAHVIDPLTNQHTVVNSTVNGRVYARYNLRWATTGMELCRVAGELPIRSGNLLGP